LVDRIDPDQHTIDDQQLLRDLIGEFLVVDRRPRIDADRGQLLEDAMKSDCFAALQCGVLRRHHATPRGREGYRVYGGNRDAAAPGPLDKMGTRQTLEALRSQAGEAMVLQNYFIEGILPNAILRKLSDEEMAAHRRPFSRARRGATADADLASANTIEGEPADVHAIATEYAHC
jgi:hypothetical protein